MLRPYVVVLRQPGIAVPLLGSFLGSLLIGMLELSVLLLARLKTGSFVEGGLVTAVLGLGNAVGIVLQGSLIDRRGQTAVLVPASLLCMTALLSLLVVVTELSGSTVLACFLAFVAGLSVPATPSSVRSLLAATISDPGLRVSGYALVAVSFTAALVLSPLVVSGLLLVAGPGAAVVVSSVLAGVSGLVFARAPGRPGGGGRPRCSRPGGLTGWPQRVCGRCSASTWPLGCWRGWSTWLCRRLR